MAEIARFIPANSGFDPEVIRILRAAYDRATAELDDHGHARVVREIIGKRIVALAAKGERDPEYWTTPRWSPLVFADEGCWFSKKYNPDRQQITAATLSANQSQTC